MSSYMIRQLPPGLIHRAKQRAREEDTTLDAVLLRYLGAYADGQTTAQLAVAGGHARAASMSPQARSEAARAAVAARWARVKAANESTE